MKVNVEIPPPTTIKMTVEMTLEEAKILKEICGKNASISRFVFTSAHQDDKRVTAGYLLAEIYNAIHLKVNFSE